jgi:hypothetical protein
MGMEWQKAIATTAILALSSCAQSPAQIKQQPTLAEYKFQTSSEIAAKCMAHGIESNHTILFASAHSIETSADVTVRTKDLPIFVVNIINEDKGSIGKLRFANGLLNKGPLIDLVSEVAKQCNGVKA